MKTYERKIHVFSLYDTTDESLLIKTGKKIPVGIYC
jgi:hypothetical protein